MKNDYIGMWTDNTRNAKIKGDQIEVVMKILILTFVLEIKESKIT